MRAGQGRTVDDLAESAAACALAFGGIVVLLLGAAVWEWAHGGR